MSAKLWRSQGEEWVPNYHITRVKTGSQSVWRSDELERRCWIEEHVPERLGLQAPGWAAQENGKEMQLWPIEWGSICCSSVWSPTTSHTQPFQIKWEVYFSKELCRSSLLCHRYDTACICIMWLYNIGSKVNVIAQLVFEFAYFKVTVLHFNHYASGSSLVCFLFHL